MAGTGGATILPESVTMDAHDMLNVSGATLKALWIIKQNTMCECDEKNCNDGHYPLGANEDGEIDWGGCPKCVKDGVHLCDKK